MKQNSKLYSKSKELSVLIPIIATVVAVTAVAIVFFGSGIFERNRKEQPVTQEEVAALVSSEETTLPIASPNYINETNYKGYLEKYPDLYEIPFKKTDDYITNKELSKTSADMFPEWEEKATSYMEALCNVKYREIMANEDAFVAKVMKTGDYEALHSENIGTENEVIIPQYVYIKNIADYYIKNQIEADAKFLTDDSLVFSDFFIFVRGELVFTIYNSNDPNLEYEVGKEYAFPMDVALRRIPSTAEWGVYAFGTPSDPVFYATH